MARNSAAPVIAVPKNRIAKTLYPIKEAKMEFARFPNNWTPMNVTSPRYVKILIGSPSKAFEKILNMFFSCGKINTS